MSKKEKGIKVIDNTKTAEPVNVEDNAKEALAALSDEQKAAMLKELGYTPHKPRAKKDTGPSPKELFNAAAEKLGAQAVAVCTALNDFPGPVSVTFERGPDDVFSANVKRVRTKYGPRKDKDS